MRPGGAIRIFRKSAGASNAARNEEGMGTVSSGNDSVRLRMRMMVCANNGSGERVQMQIWKVGVASNTDVRSGAAMGAVRAMSKLRENTIVWWGPVDMIAGRGR